MRHSMIVLIAAAAIIPLHAQADDLGLIAVLPFGVTGPNDGHLQLDTLTESIRTATGDALSPLGYTVLTGENTLRILQDNGIDAAKACEGSCALDVAKEMKARLFVSGIVSTAEGNLVAFIRIFDGVSGRQLGSLQLEGQVVRDLRVAFTAKAPEFFQAAIAKLKEAGDVPVTDAPGKVPVVLETPTNGQHFSVALRNAQGLKSCPQDVTYIQPCKLNLLPGPLDLNATGTNAIEKAFELKAPGARVSFASPGPGPGSPQPIIGMVVGIVGGMAALGGTVFGVTSMSPSATCGTGCGGEPATPSAVQLGKNALLYCAVPGAVVGIVGLILGLTAPPPQPLPPTALVSDYDPAKP